MPQSAHSYVKTHQLKGDVMRLMPHREATAIESSAAYKRSGRTAKTLVNSGPLGVEVIALRKGESMAEHSVKGHVTIHVLSGGLRVTTKQGPADLRVGELLVLAPRVGHSVVARRDARFLLTLALDR